MRPYVLSFLIIPDQTGKHYRYDLVFNQHYGEPMYSNSLNEVANDLIPLDDLRTIDGLATEFGNILSVAVLRWQLRHRVENGLNTACVRVGKRLLISKSRYEQWLATRVEGR